MVTISAGIWNCCVINPFNAPHRNPQTIAAKIPGIHPNSESTLMNVIQTTFVKETIDPKEISIPPIKRQIVCPKATIINGDATDHDLLVEEGIDEADAFVALTGMDEENIILSLFAKSQNVDKIVTKVNEDRRARMVEDFGIDSIVSVKTATADAIMSYVRARKNSQGSANVETMYQLVDDKVEALEFIVKAETNYTGIPLKNLSLKPNNLIACIARKRQIILPSGEDCIQVGDNVIIITMEKRIEDIKDILM